MNMLRRIVASAGLYAVLGLVAMLAVQAPASAHNWQELHPTPPLPAARIWATTVHDPATNRLILFGGMGPCCVGRNDLWILTNADGSKATKPQWMEVLTDAPLTRRGHSADYNPATNRMIVFGGSNISFQQYNDVWILTNANGLGGVPQWQLLPIAPGSHPLPQELHATVYDRQHNRLIVFGGLHYVGETPVVLNDTWVLTNADGTEVAPSQWIHLAPTGPLPAKRFWTFAAYDPATNQMLIFGGAPFGEKAFNDIWVLANANGMDATPPHWVKRTPASILPPPRAGMAGGYDPTSDRVVVFGGVSNWINPNPLAYNDTWLLKDAFAANPRWVRRAPLGTIPPPYYWMASAYSPSHDTLMFTSGSACLSGGCNNYSNRTFLLRAATK